MSYYINSATGEYLRAQFQTSEPDTPITIGAYVKLADWGTTRQVIVNFGENFTSWNNSHILQHPGVADRLAAASRSTTTAGATYDGTTDEWNGIWVPVVGVYVAQADRDVYIDDISQTGNNTTNYNLNNLSHLAVGCQVDNDFGILDGYVGHVAVWDVVLTNSQVYAFLNASRQSDIEAIAASNLIGYWPMNESGVLTNQGTATMTSDMAATGATFLSDDPFTLTEIKYTVGEQQFGSSVTEISPTAPPYDSGDLLVGIGYRSNDGDCYYNDGETSWTEDTEYQTTGPDYTGYVAWKVATSSNMGTIDFGTTGAASILRARVIRVNAGTFDPVNPMDAVSTTVQQNNTDDPDPAAITTVTDNARVFTFVYTGNADDAQSRTPPSGYTLDGENQGAGEFALASKEIATAAAENPGAWSGFSTGATADMGVITFAIRPAPSATLTSIVQSTERVTIDWDATSEPVTQNLSKGQDETRCVPFFTKRLVSGSLTDDFRERTMKVEMIDNAGTPAVRVTASGKSSANDHRIEVYVVEFVPGIGVQQVDADIADTNSSANITITDVGAQTDAFFLYSYQYTHGSAQDRPDYACVRPVWNGASTTSVTIERTGSTGTIDGMLYVVSCENSEFSVQHRDISVAATDELTNDTITASPMATTFLLTHFRSSEAEDDPLDWSFVADLSTTTNVRVRRSIAGASNAAANVGVQVVTAQGGQWSVQRGDFTTTSNLTEQTVISAVDLTRAFVKTGTHESGLNSLGTSDLTAGTIIDEVGPAAYLSATNTITWVRESVSETGNTIPYEVIQFSAGLDNPILIPTGPLR